MDELTQMSDDCVVCQVLEECMQCENCPWKLTEEEEAEIAAVDKARQSLQSSK